MTGTGLEILIGKWYAAPPELVFRAFTEGALLEQWFLPDPDVALRVEQCDARPGGAYRFQFFFPDGRMRLVIGHYITVDKPRRLEFTWSWEPPDPWAGLKTRVNVEFVVERGGTQVNIHHANLAEEPMRQVHGRGWAGTLASLEKFLEGDRLK